MLSLLNDGQRLNVSAVWMVLALLLCGQSWATVAGASEPPDQEKIDRTNATLDKLRDRNQRGPTFLEFVDVINNLDDKLRVVECIHVWDHLKALQKPKLSAEKLAELVGKKQDQIANFILEVEEVRTDEAGQLISDQGNKFEFANSGEKFFVRTTHAANPGLPTTISFDGEVIRYRQTQSRLYAPDTKDVSMYDLTQPGENPLWMSGLMNSEKVFGKDFADLYLGDVDLQYLLLFTLCIVFEEMVDVDGTPCVALSDFNSVYFLDPKLNYALIHRHSWQYDQKELKFKKSERGIKFEAYKDLGKGLWIPMRMTRFDSRSEKKAVLTLIKAQINKGVSDDYFTTGIFPEGEEIIDLTAEDLPNPN